MRYDYAYECAKAVLESKHKDSNAKPNSQLGAS